MKKTVLLFGLLITALLILFQISKYRIRVTDYTSEIVITITSVVFFFAGIYYTRQKKVSNVDAQPDKSAEFSSASETIAPGNIPDYEKIKELGLSSRELEVLNELIKGHTNKQISENLFISESTTKTHLSNLFNKLKVSNRSQAIIRSEELKLVRRNNK